MYQALYRKWRPQNFADMVGQEHVTKTLVRQVETDRLSHAYLLTGTRGTGKTTCAKVLAKAVNCQNRQDGNPCNSCEACKGIDDGSILDVLELDAASNNGVDQVRALRDEAVYTPGSVKMRVYIIDEVHMLTDQAENALLKILEEPPKHLLFILATTEQHKVMATIRSRCQQFTFKRIHPQAISKRLTFVAQEEQIQLSPQGADLLARLADGGLRDALSLLDQCRNSELVDETHILQVLGLAGNMETSKMMESIAIKDSEAAVVQLGKLYENGRDIGSVLEELAVLARDLLLLQTAPNHGASLLAGGYDQQTLDALVPKLPTAQLLYILTILQESSGKLSKSSHRRTDGELCLLRLCEPSLEDSTIALAARIAKLEANSAPQMTASSPTSSPVETKPTTQTLAAPMSPPQPIAAPVTQAPAVSPPMAPPQAPKQEKPLIQDEADLFMEPPMWLDENNVPDGLFAGFEGDSQENNPMAPPVTAPPMTATPMAPPMTVPPMAPPMTAPPMAPPMTAPPVMAPQATPTVAPAMVANSGQAAGSGQFWPTFYPKLKGKVPEPAWPYFVGQPPKVIGRYVPGVLTLWVNQPFTKKRLEVPGCIEAVQNVASELFGTPVQVFIQIGQAPPEDNVEAQPLPTMAQPVAEPMAQPMPTMPQPVAEPMAQPMAEPMAQPVAEPMAQPMAEPMAQPVAEPMAQSMAAPMAQPVAEPMPQPVAKPMAQSMAEPMAQSMVEDPLDELITLGTIFNEE